MRIIVAGSRDVQDENLVFSLLDHSFGKSIAKIECVICGMARGADLLGKKWAETKGVAVKEMPADWSLGRSAGYKRNVEMAQIATHVIIFWDGLSKGSKHMLDIAVDKGLWVKIVRTDRITE